MNNFTLLPNTSLHQLVNNTSAQSAVSIWPNHFPSNATMYNESSTWSTEKSLVSLDSNLWKRDFALYLVVVILYLSLSIIGICGNTLVILSILTNRALRSIANVFIVYLALADLGITAIVEPFSLLPIFVDPNIYKDNSGLCYWFGIMCSISCCGSPTALAFIGLNRYVCVCHNKYYTKLFSRKGAAISFLLLFLYSWMPIYPVAFGFGKIVYDQRALLCGATGPHHFGLYISIVQMYLPVAMVTFFNLMIFISVHQSKKSLRKLTVGEDKHGESHSRMSKEHVDQEMRLARTLLVIFVTLVVCLCPWAILLNVDTKNEVPIYGYHFAAIVYHTNSSVNPILYGLSNERFRRGYVEFLSRVCPCVPESWKSLKSQNLSSHSASKTSMSIVSEAK